MLAISGLTGVLKICSLLVGTMFVFFSVSAIIRELNRREEKCK